MFIEVWFGNKKATVNLDHVLMIYPHSNGSMISVKNKYQSTDDGYTHWPYQIIFKKIQQLKSTGAILLPLPSQEEINQYAELFNEELNPPINF